jgi:hypothetical protein
VKQYEENLRAGGKERRGEVLEEKGSGVMLALLVGR